MRIKRSHRRPDASFIHESTPSRPGGGGDTGSNRGDAGGNDYGPGDDGNTKDEDMADAPDGGPGASESRPSGDYGGSHSANNGDTQSNAGDSEMAQD